MPNKANESIIDQLSKNISTEVGNMHEDELSAISTGFDSTLDAALRKFNSTMFDNDGFVKRMRELDIGKDSEVVKNVLNTMRSDYVSVDVLSQTELLLRRDINNVCMQMPEMRDVIYLTRDNIIEANTATGEVSRSLIFENHQNTEALETQVKELEERYQLLPALKNFIIPNQLMSGEKYVHVVPYAKLFAELELMNQEKGGKGQFRESIPNYVSESFHEKVSLYSESNLKAVMESVGTEASIDSTDEYRIDHGSDITRSKATSESVSREGVAAILKSIDVFNGSSVNAAELGYDGFRDLVYREYVEDQRKAAVHAPKSQVDKFQHYMERFMQEETNSNDLLKSIDQDDVDTKSYSSIKGCYIKYMDSLKMCPIRMDRRIIGYYYVTTTLDLQTNAGNQNGFVDLSFQHYTRDRKMVDKLADLIIRSFDKKMLEKNIKLKNEIADVIMAHKFTEGRLSFIYIPENEIVRYAIDEDEFGKGHSMIEPSLFAARSYIMLDLYNMLYTLNNNTTRIHYLKSSGLNKNYAAQIQRAIRKFQSRRITIDDIYSYSGVLNKIGGMGEMVLPAGRGDFKALETDTIEAVQNPINSEFLEQKRRQALSGTGAPHLLIINAMEEVDFAKTVEMANARYQSRCNSFKLDINTATTKLYQMIMRYCTDLDEDTIRSFKFKLNEGKQQDLNITSDMINNFNSLVDVVMNIYGGKGEWEDKNGNPSHKQVRLRRELARKYLPQLDHDELDEIMKKVNVGAMNDDLQDKVAEVDISDEDLKTVEKK